MPQCGILFYFFHIFAPVNYRLTVRRLYILFFLVIACAITSCGDNHKTSDSEPIAAKTSLNSDILKQYEAIIVADSLYKNYLPQSNDSAVTAATAYFDSISALYPKDADLAYKTARAHYYKAIGEQEKDDIVSACRDYLMAAEMMQKNKYSDYDIIKFNGLIYERLGKITYNENCIRQSKDAYNRAFKCFQTLNDSVALAINRKQIGYCYYIDNSLDSAIMYYKEAILWTGGKASSTATESKRCIASIYHKNDMRDSAYIMIRDLIRNSSGVELSYNKIALAHMFHSDKVYDSAIIYLSDCLTSDNKYTSISAAKHLSDIYSELGDETKSLYYKNLYSDNYFKEIERSSAKAEMISLYEDFLKKTSQNKKSNTLKIVLTFIVGILIVFAIIIALNNKHKKRISNLINEITILKKKEKTGEDRWYKKGLVKIVNDPSFAKMELAKKADIKSTHTNTYDYLRLTKGEKDAFIENVNRYFGDFLISLGQEYTKMGYDDILCCGLIFVGMNNKEIGALMGVQYNTVRDRTRKIASFLMHDDLSVMLKKYAKAHLSH